jgi:hypothetical protein
MLNPVLPRTDSILIQVIHVPQPVPPVGLLAGTKYGRRRYEGNVMHLLRVTQLHARLCILRAQSLGACLVRGDFPNLGCLSKKHLPS